MSSSTKQPLIWTPRIHLWLFLIILSGCLLWYFLVFLTFSSNHIWFILTFWPLQIPHNVSPDFWNVNKLTTAPSFLGKPGPASSKYSVFVIPPDTRACPVVPPEHSFQTQLCADAFYDWPFFFPFFLFQSQSRSLFFKRQFTSVHFILSDIVIWKYWLYRSVETQPRGNYSCAGCLVSHTPTTDLLYDRWPPTPGDGSWKTSQDRTGHGSLK